MNHKAKINNKIVITCIAILGCIITIAIIIFLSVFIWAGINVVFGVQDATDISRSISASITSSSDYSKNGSRENELCWYDTVEEALQNDELIKDDDIIGEEVDYKKSDSLELVRIQNKDKLAILYTRTPEEGDITRIFYVILRIESNKFSQPYMVGRYGNGPGYVSAESGKPDFIYDCDDSVVFYLLRETVTSNVFGQDREDKIPLCFGMWKDKDEIESLTVAGEKPEIIEITAKEDIRYFWYFEDPQWLEQLEKINWGDFTYRQVIDKLDIKYIKSIDK